LPPFALLVLSSDPMPAVDEILPQSTPHDTHHSLPRFLKFGAGSRSGHLLLILGVGFGLAVGIGNTIAFGNSCDCDAMLSTARALSPLNPTVYART
jgi:hypothetical protein